MKQELPRSIGVWGGMAITVGVMVGTGIYRTPTTIANEMGSPAVILLMWLAGGILCLFGALTFSELATMFPKAGGVYVFLREGYGRMVAFVFGWTYFLLTQPMAIAGIAIVFAEYLSSLLLAHNIIDEHFSPQKIGIITCGVIIVLTGINVTGMKRGATTAIILTGVKTLALVAIVALALIMNKGSSENFAAVTAPKPFLSALIPVLAAILWTYDGWSDAAAVAEEVKEPQKKLPRILLLGTGSIMLLYLAVNAVYFWLMPIEEMGQTKDLAPVVIEKLIGPAGGTVVSILAMITFLGSTHASIIVGSRVTFAQARDGLLFAFQARVHPKYKTPATALWIQALLACTAVIVLKRFETLMEGFVFSIWIFYGMSAATVFIFRIRRPNATRPYRCWGYPIIPAIFVFVAAFMTVLSMIPQPGKETLLGMDKYSVYWLLVLAVGVPAYYLWTGIRKSSK